MGSNGFQGLLLEDLVGLHDLGVDDPATLVDQDTKARNRRTFDDADSLEYDDLRGCDEFGRRVDFGCFERTGDLLRIRFG